VSEKNKKWGNITMTISHPEGNYFDKYTNKNLAIKRIMSAYFHNLDIILNEVEASMIYDSGCGEGYVSQHIAMHYLGKKEIVKIVASDLSNTLIEKAIMDYPNIQFCQCSIYDTKEQDNSYDFVLATEVLEHLEAPEKALNELFRISKKYILISVPNEPIWRITNILRGKYWKDFGNTPGHVNHWSTKDILNILKEHGEIDIVRKPFPWTMVLCKKREM
jgi:2-polyprenyl-3-methyl-5-hydroxy-6-metoxy-1,4-benzoquinol methylase